MTSFNTVTFAPSARSWPYTPCSALLSPAVASTTLPMSCNVVLTEAPSTSSSARSPSASTSFPALEMAELVSARRAPPIVRTVFSIGFNAFSMVATAVSASFSTGLRFGMQLSVHWTGSEMSACVVDPVVLQVCAAVIDGYAATCGASVR